MKLPKCSNMHNLEKDQDKDITGIFLFVKLIEVLVGVKTIK